MLLLLSFQEKVLGDQIRGGNIEFCHTVDTHVHEYNVYLVD